MAGRILVIEFDDAAQADALRARIDKATQSGKRYRTIGLFSRPRGPYCSCGANHVSERGKPAKSKWSRKYGFRICTNCNKYLPELYGLKNLIAPEEIIEPPEHEWKYRGQTIRGIFYMGILNALPHTRSK